MPSYFTRHARALAALALTTALAAAWQPSRAEPIGRLFFTPAERARTGRAAPPEIPPAPPPRLDGIITRSAGHPTLFLDGQAISAPPRDVRIADATARVIGPDGRRHRLRVGDPAPDAR